MVLLTETARQVLALFANNAKHNQEGRLDEHGVLRHYHVDMCPVGALAFYFYGYFHVLGRPPPNFAPIFDNKQHGPYGQRAWHSYHVFFTDVDELSKQMPYETHRDRLKVMHESNGIHVSKVTHATRIFFAQNARTNGASESGTKAAGGWQDGAGSFRKCYERTFPIDALLGAAMFNARKPESYALPRNELEPPPELLATLFPWVEEELCALEKRSQENSNAQDYALRHFLTVLVWFRTVILQDAALLFSKDPSYALWSYEPFCRPAFRAFAANAEPELGRAAERTRAVYQLVPEHMVAGFRDLTTGMLFGQQRHQVSVNTRLANVEQLLTMFMPAQQLLSREKSGMVSSLAMSVINADCVSSSSSEVLTHSAHPLAFDLSPASIGKTHDITFDDSAAGTLCTPLTGNSMTLDPGCALPETAPTAVSAPCTNTTLPQLQPSALALAPANSYMTPHSDPLLVRQLEQQQHLISELGEAQFYLHRPWQQIGGQLVPSYSFQPASTVADLWAEWTTGLNGYMSVSLLVNRWSTKWRKGDAAKRTESSRRKKVIDLIERLKNKHRWDAALALRFLQDEYGKMTAPQFSKYLSSGGGQSDKVFAAAQSYITSKNSQRNL